MLKDYVFFYFLNFYRDYCHEVSMDEKDMNDFFTAYTKYIEIK